MTIYKAAWPSYRKFTSWSNLIQLLCFHLCILYLFILDEPFVQGSWCQFLKRTVHQILIRDWSTELQNCILDWSCTDSKKIMQIRICSEAVIKYYLPTQNLKYHYQQCLSSNQSYKVMIYTNLKPTREIYPNTSSLLHWVLKQHSYVLLIKNCKELCFTWLYMQGAVTLSPSTRTIYMLPMVQCVE